VGAATITIRSSDQGDSVTDELIAMAWADERVCAGSSRAGTCAPGVNFAIRSNSQLGANQRLVLEVSPYFLRSKLLGETPK
jgi:hypothetical protein